MKRRKLTERDVLEIRAWWAMPVIWRERTHRQMAQKFGVHHELIRQVAHRMLYKDVR